ncbi:Leucine-rich repeat-containing protein [Cynara cardunculus var. scolymus]|uniref:Leucine-rich repeat-containing protein n=1 Tax=Cynara cardunculus var. scolymus TaxID=59895 RepID=A0A103XWM6_CYNCS|nr:Leucine-rich repeat-containing protein [Cynara cardunculus var. scolymus]
MDRIRSIFWAVFVFVLLLFSPAKTEDEGVITALLAFMDKLAPGGAQITPNWGWNASSDPCTSKWVGITCDRDNKTVKKIVLERLNLSGTLDVGSVCKVSNLLVLSLSFNNVTGNVQPEISNCVRLTHLYLSGNRFSGDLPDSLAELPNVKRVVVSNNGFAGELPDFSGTTGLLTFLAQNNRFTGQIPGFNYRQLEDFSVANNDLSGPIPDDTGRFDASSFAGNPQLCGKQLPVTCPLKKKKHKSKLRDFLIYSGYVILGFVVVVLIALLLLKKKKQRHEDVKIDPSTKKSPESGGSSGSRNSRARSEFSITSVESGGISSSMVVLSSPVVNGLRFEDLLKAPAELIGRGKHGSLYRVKPDGGVGLVVKRIKDWKISRDEFKKRMQKIDQIKHPNVLPLVAYYSSKQEKLLVYEFQLNGSLFGLLHGSQNGQMFDWGGRLSVASSIAAALAFMHQELQADLIPHGNLKSSNILLKNNMEPCLSEYGLMARDHQDPNQTNNHTTITTFKADVYAFGVILLELLTGKPVQDDGSGLIKWVSSVVQEEWTVEVFDKALIVEGASEERMVGLLQVALKCINASPELRPTMGLLSYDDQPIGKGDTPLTVGITCKQKATEKKKETDKKI